MLQPRRECFTPQLQRGFTIIETMIVVVVLGVMVAIAIPAMKDMVTTQRVKASSYDLFTDLIYARSEAISRGSDVALFSASGTADWQPGWAIREAAGGTTLREASARSTDLTFTGPGPSVTFDRTGRATAVATAQFSIVPVATAPDFQKRCLRLDPSGRARTANGAC